MYGRIRLTCVLLFLLPAISCAELASVRIADVPHVQQKPDFCGEACAEMYLRKLGSRWTQDQVFDVSGLDPAQGRGCYAAEMNAALKKIGFATGEVWTRIPARDNAKQIEEAFAAMHADLGKGVPSIVCMYASDAPKTTEHFRLIVGYDAKADAVIYHEPGERDGAYRTMARAKFTALWPLRGQKEHTLIRMKLEAGKLAEAPKPAGSFSRADFAQHVLKLKEKLPAGFAVVIEPPFVVVGDEPAERVRQHSTNTVAWAASRLKAEYFAKDPADILTVWLFKDKASYEKHTKAIFGAVPSTPFGYFSNADKALVMNISTGGGTLVHEIVHPYMATNFPDCPAWFNEGMGSLYEQCYDRNGRIWGSTNWRLAGLQKGIEAKALPSFEKLCGTTTNGFYNQDKGTNYAQARYLLYYLQEKGLLKQYYKEFVAGAEKDPTGYATLQRVLGEKDMADFQKRWEAWVMKLKFP